MGGRSRWSAMELGVKMGHWVWREGERLEYLWLAYLIP